MPIETKAQKDKHWQPVPGSECLITDLGGDAQVAQRLAQMGVLPGSRLRVVRLGRIALLSLALSLVSAWLASLVFYQTGLLAGLG